MRVLYNCIIVKNCIIIHGGPLIDKPEEPHNLHELYWQPWIKNELNKNGINCVVPPMPNPWLPKYSEWKESFENHVINKETILVGHSRGVAFLVRWLGDTKQQIGKLIMIAPNLKTESKNPILQDFYTFDIDTTIKSLVTERIVFTSENDELENMESAKLLAEVLNCRVVNLPKHGHFITQEMGTNEFPELVVEIIK